MCEYLCERQALQKAGKLTASFHKSEKNVSGGAAPAHDRANTPIAGKNPHLGEHLPREMKRNLRREMKCEMKCEMESGVWRSIFRFPEFVCALRSPA